MTTGTVIFRDEFGNEGTYTFPCSHDGEKMVQVITRAEVRLGIHEETPEQKAHWRTVRAAAAARAPKSAMRPATAEEVRLWREGK